MIHTMIKSRERSNESSSFSNNLMKRQSFRASRGMGETAPSLHPTSYGARSVSDSRAHYRPLPPKIKSWLRAWGGVQPATRFYLLVALIHCRKYFGTYHPPQPRIQIDTLEPVIDNEFDKTRPRGAFHKDPKLNLSLNWT